MVRLTLSDAASCAVEEVVHVTQEPDVETLYVTIRVRDDRPTLPEVVEALSAVDDAWGLAYRLTTGDALLRGMDEVAIASRGDERLRLRSFLRPSEIGQLTDELDDYDDVPRPAVELSRQSPLVIGLSDVIATGVTAAGTIGVWRSFKYLVSNAEAIAGLPHRLRFGWHSARADADEARVRALAARGRLELEKLELARARELASVSRNLRRLGQLEIESNVPDDPSSFA